LAGPNGLSKYELMKRNFMKIASFKGPLKDSKNASKTAVAYKDFAHSRGWRRQPQAVKEQYPNRTLVACLELHTYSS
jgi:UDP-N-acetylmuramate: L-alanyl-gamma-D-glutamyl-meso-diaminopimelate ligase